MIHNPRTVAIIQARMGSTRLPGKILLDLGGEPVLARVMERAKRAKRLSQVTVATSDLPADNVIPEVSHQRGWPCFRGSESDVSTATTMRRWLSGLRWWSASPPIVR